MSQTFKPLVSIPEPAQARSQKALERFLVVGEVMLAHNGYEEASIAEIAREAKSSSGTFYRLLEDKETLLRLLIQRFLLNVEKQVSADLNPAQWENVALTVFVDAFLETLLSVNKGRAGVLRALILRASKDAAFKEQVHKLNNFIASHVAKVLSLYINEINHPNPESAIVTVTHMVLGIINHHTVTGDFGGLTQKEFNLEVKRMFTRYLGINTF